MQAASLESLFSRRDLKFKERLRGMLKVFCFVGLKRRDALNNEGLEDGARSPQ